MPEPAGVHAPDSPAARRQGVAFHAVQVGGGILATSPQPGAGGDYAGDLAHIAEWAPAFVISLVSHLELFEAGATALGQDIQDKGTRWVHLPVRDHEAPNANFESAWPAVSDQARRALAGGGRVLVHCKAGCGRSGMVALRLMIESGEPPEDALSRLRAVRSCAVETDAQMRWARKGRPQALPLQRRAGLG